MAFGISAGAAILGGSLISGAAGIYGASQQAGAMKDAANTQAGSEAQAMAIQQQMFNQQQANNQPWMQAGTQALGQMQGMAANPVNFTQKDFLANQDPAYGWDMQQGQQALERSAAARGGLMSGGTMKDLTSYAQGQASNEYGNAYNRFMNNQKTTFDRLGTIAGMGQTAASGANSAAQNYGANAGALATGLGNSQAASTIGQANAWGGAIGNIGSQAGNGLTMGALYNSMSPGRMGMPQSPMQSPGPGAISSNLGNDFGGSGTMGQMMPLA